MVRDHGKESEARQYAGRGRDDAWVAPFEAGVMNRLAPQTGTSFQLARASC